MSSNADILPVSATERLLAWLTALVVMPLAMLALAGPTLFVRPFWSDEVLSWLIASDADLGHGLAALAGGVDTNAPLLHLLLHGAGNLFGHTPLVYRLLAAGMMALAMTGLYLTLRRCVSWRGVAVGVLALWSMPIVLSHTTEARFYAPMLAGATWTAYWLACRMDRPTLASAIGLAVASAALCGIHYFGVVVLGALLLGAVAMARKRIIDIGYPAIAGLATTASLWPLLSAQRAAMASVGGTWVPDDFAMNLKTVVWTIAPTTVCVGLLAIGGIACGAAGRKRVAEWIGQARTPLWGLGAYVVAMVVFDRLVQPVLVPRYFIVALPLVALAVAVMVDRLSRREFALAATVAGVMLVGHMVRMRGLLASPAERTSMGVLATVQGIGDEPIVSDWLGHALPIWQTHPERRGQVHYVADRRLRDPGFQQAIPYERQMAACVRMFYGLPRETTLTDIDRLERFVLISEFPESVEARFPGWTARRIGEVTFEMTQGGHAATKSRVGLPVELPRPVVTIAP